MQPFSHLEDQIRECFGRVVYTHKTHEKEAEECSRTLSRFKVAQIVLTALTTSGAVGVLIVDEGWLKFVTAGLALLSLLVSGYMKGFDPGATAQKHRDAAAALWNIRESYLSLLTDLRMNAVVPEIARERRDELQTRLAALHKGAPQTHSSAYAKAQKALQHNEEYTFAEGEIDLFLPSTLRKGRDAPVKPVQ
jgi:hypothetical protein